MNAAATELGPALNTVPASFIEFKPAQFLRPFDARNLEGEGDSNSNGGH
jgi:hypothetical protein